MKKPKKIIPPFKGGHKIITWAAMQCLPEWQRQLWKDELYRLADVYSLYGDTYYEKKEELGPFVKLPDGTVPVCSVGVLREKRHYREAVDYWESPFYDVCERILTYYLKRISKSIKQGDISSAAQFAGSAAHYLEDSGVPAHAADNGDLEFIRDYFPTPKKFMCFPLHGYTERSPELFLLNGYWPRLYGMSAEEAGANFVDRYVELVLYARRLLVPLAQTVYNGNDKKAGQLRLKAAKMCGRIFADYIYSATCIGAGQYAKKDVSSLDTLSLAPRWPYRMTAWAPAPYFEPAPLRLVGINLDMKRNPVGCQLFVKKNNSVRPRRFENALGAGAYFEYHYRVPKGVYARFAALVGIHSRLGAKRNIDVEVKLDDKPAFKAIIKPGKPALAIDIQAHGCRDIRLISSGPQWTDPDACDNHVVWANPRLIK